MVLLSAQIAEQFTALYEHYFKFRRDLAKWGIRDTQTITLRSDQENALEDLVAAMADARGDSSRTVIELSAVGESQKNGFIEVGVKSLREWCERCG